MLGVRISEEEGKMDGHHGTGICQDQGSGNLSSPLGKASRLD